MEITKEMYLLAKKVVSEYEGKDKPSLLQRLRNNRAAYKVNETEETKAIREKIDKLFEANNYLNPFKEGEIMPCCGERYAFSYATMKYMPRNPDLEYRKKDAEGDVHYDSNSRHPSFVQYNNCREAIRQAKKKGLRHVHWRISTATLEEITQDGYVFHNDSLNTISW